MHGNFFKNILKKTCEQSQAISNDFKSNGCKMKQTVPALIYAPYHFSIITTIRFQDQKTF